MSKRNKVKEEKPKLISGIFEEELINIIDERFKLQSEVIPKSDLKEIANILLPDINMLISRVVKEHMEALGEKMIQLSK